MYALCTLLHARQIVIHGDVLSIDNVNDMDSLGVPTTAFQVLLYAACTVLDVNSELAIDGLMHFSGGSVNIRLIRDINQGSTCFINFIHGPASRELPLTYPPRASSPTSKT